MWASTQYLSLIHISHSPWNTDREIVPRRNRVVREVLGMRPPHRLRFVQVPGEAFQRELPDCLQHREAWLVIDIFGYAHQALVDQRGEFLEDIQAALAVGHRFRGLQCPSPGEDTKAAKEDAFFFTQQVMAPRNRSAQRLLPLGQILSPACQEGQTRVKPRQERRWGKNLAAGGSQFQSER